MDMGAMKVNIEEDEWGKWEYDEDHDGEFDPKLQGSEVGGGELHAEHRRVGAVDLGGVHAEDGQGSHHHQVGRRRQGPRRGGAEEQERRAKNFDVFAAPPLEMKRLLFRMARVKGSVGGNDKDGQVKLMYIDVKKAHLNGEVDDDDFAPKGGWWRCGATTAVVIWDAARSICVEEHHAANLKN